MSALEAIAWARAKMKLDATWFDRAMQRACQPFSATAPTLAADLNVANTPEAWAAAGGFKGLGGADLIIEVESEVVG